MQIESPEKEHELGYMDIKKLLYKYSSPAIIAMVVNSVYNLVDTIFVGRGVGTIGIAGLAIAFPIQMLIMAIAQTVGIGAASIISRSLGEGNQRRAEKTAGNSFTIVTVLSIAFSVLGLIFLTPLLKIFGATSTILPYARDYMAIILAGSFFFSFAMSANNVVRAEGFAKTAMISMLLGAGMNILLDPVLIFGFNMGIKGAALATISAQAGSFIYLVLFFRSGKSLLRVRREDLTVDWSLVPELFAIGAASFTRTVAGSLFAIAVNNSLAYYGTDLHIAILGVGNRLIMLLMMPIFGIVQGLQPIVGYNYGSRKIARVKHSLKLAIWAATGIACFGFLVLMFFTEPLVRIFNDDPVLVAEGAPLIRTMTMMIPIIGLQIVGSSLFQAIGRAVPALFLSMSRQLLFLIPLVLILPLSFGLIGVFYAFPLADLLSSLVTFYWVRREDKIMTAKFA